MPTASKRLRHETRAAHERVEQIGFARALQAGKVARAAYVDYLRSLATIVSTFATQVSRHGAARERAFLGSAVRWVDCLQQDLRDLAGPGAPANPSATAVALGAASAIRRHVGTDSGYLVGLSYVLHGSHLGNRMLAPAVTEALGLHGEEGTRYLRASAHEAHGWWAQFKRALDEALASETEVDVAVGAATETFETFERLLEALSTDPPRRLYATALNPEAGEHPIPSDPALVELALRVSQMCGERFPYLLLRFGERGERYARSDSAWLLTLCDLPPEVVRDQIDWLARLLSARGIPTICLEVHLDALADALSEMDPAPADHRSLRENANRLRARRQEAIGTEPAIPLEAAARDALGPEGANLLLAAIADQRTGVAACADNIGTWAETATGLGAEARAQITAFLARSRAPR